METDNVDVILNSLCYSFWQAVDGVCVCYLNADEDREVEFLQVKHIAQAICERYETCTEDVRKNCFDYSDFIMKAAGCESFEEYEQLSASYYM